MRHQTAQGRLRASPRTASRSPSLVFNVLANLPDHSRPILRRMETGRPASHATKPKYLSYDRTVYPQATLLLKIGSFRQSIQCRNLSFELRDWLAEQAPYLRATEIALAVEYRENKKRKLTCTLYGRESEVVIVEGWDHESFGSWSDFSGKSKPQPEEERKVVFDEYLKYIQMHGARILADFRGAPLARRNVSWGARGFPKGSIPDELLDNFLEEPELPNKSPPEHAGISPYHLPVASPDEIMDEPGMALMEGASTTITVNRYERDPVARRRCIEHFGLNSQVCNINFSLAFPGIGDGCIHVHHLIPLSEIGQSYQVDPIRDLIPVCPNCHAMIHRRNPPYTPAELKAAMGGGAARS